jgi:hypothetical protein
MIVECQIDFLIDLDQNPHNNFTKTKNYNMPTNLPREWSLIDEEYRAAKNLDEKIEALKRLIAATPKHKGTSHLLAELRKKLSKLEDE